MSDQSETSGNAASTFAPLPDAPRSSVLARIARWGMAHRRVVVIAWLVAVIAVSAFSRIAGANYVNNLSLPGTDSQRSTDLLKRDFATQAGDRDQIVLRARTGTLAGPAARADVTAMLARVARLPHVTAVAGPYAQGGGISKDRTIGFATVSFDQQSTTLPQSATKKVIATAQAIESPGLQVELGGPAIQRTEQQSLGFATIVGLIAAAAVLLISFGSLWAMAVPIVIALFGLGIAIGLIGLGTNLTDLADASKILALMIGLGVGIDYALFVVTRFRETYRANGGNVADAIESAMDTAGRAILFAGCTVVIAMLGMLALGISLLNGVAIATALTVLIVLVAALTMLPALLSFAGHRIGRPGRRARVATDTRPSFWTRWVGVVQQRPWLTTLAATTLLAVLAAPALGFRLGSSDAGNDPASHTTRKAYDMLAQGFGRGFNGPLQVVAKLPHGHDRSALTQLQTALTNTSGVASVTTPRLNPAGTTATLAVYPTTSPQSSQTTSLVKRLRHQTVPPMAARTRSTVYIGGATATQIDFAHILAQKIWYFAAMVIALSATLLLIVFRSLLIPLQAALMNLLSIGAALGIAQAVFERGWGAGLLGAQAGPIEAFIPVIVFAIVFGLSMDYEVFLVSRIHEDWTHHHDPSRAIREGITHSGRVIAAAASVMVVVFLSFIAGGQRATELFGLTLASAVFLDALVIRCLLLPAVLQLAGRATWVFPRRLDRRLPRLAIEPAEPG